MVPYRRVAGSLTEPSYDQGGAKPGSCFEQSEGVVNAQDSENQCKNGSGRQSRLICPVLGEFSHDWWLAQVIDERNLLIRLSLDTDFNE